MIGALLALAGVGVVEAVVHLVRYRTATARSAAASAAATLAVAATRVWFVLAGVSAAMGRAPWWAVVPAYAVPAAAATWLAHELLERRRAPSRPANAEASNRA